MDMSLGIVIAMVLGPVAGVYAWKMTKRDYDWGSGLSTDVIVNFSLLFFRVMMVLNVVSACQHVTVWALLLAGASNAGTDLSAIVDRPGAGPLCILYAVAFWIPIKAMALDTSSPKKKLK